MASGIVTVGDQQFHFNPLPGKLLDILEKGGLVNAVIGNQ
jgi:hypothetical protein